MPCTCLLNLPGAPSAIATTLDGYPLARRDEAGTAIGPTTVVSVLRRFVGILALAGAAPAVASLALKFAPPDDLLLAIQGLLRVGSLSGGSLAQGLFSGALGVLIGSVGLDPIRDHRWALHPRAQTGSAADDRDVIPVVVPGRRVDARRRIG